MRPLGTSLGHIHSYCTCISMSILNQPIGRCEQIMRFSAWPRSTPSRSHHEHSIDSCRGRRVANGNSLQHADSLCVARMRSAASWAAHRHEQPYTGASEDRASDAQEHDLLTLATAASSPAMTCIVSKRYPRGLRPPSSCSTDLAECRPSSCGGAQVKGCQLQQRSQGGFEIKEMLIRGAPKVLGDRRR